MMMTLNPDALVHVTGGASNTAALTQSLTAIQGSLSSLANTNNNSSSNNLLLPVMMMAMNRQRQSAAVVSANGATVVSY